MSYSIIFKRYAPFTTFGGGFHGDGRNSPNFFGTARCHGQVAFDFTKGYLSCHAHSDPTWHKWTPSKVTTQKPTITMSGCSCSSGTVKFTAHTAGSNPQAPGSPPIDTFIEVEATASRIKAKVFGDPFPNCEVFLKKNNAPSTSTVPTLSALKFELLGDYRTPHGPQVGPLTKLWGQNRSNLLLTIDHCITI
ncbi:hypothetical protein IV417_02235 [Alphaproteobacteria bacterium KMM 3653]|uniref:Uncharacterized protein n=1 Tax=Harenicola maris TaxID=2841044 RepID=A0AAP2CN72_9RHOB|nr:hypothetical protein [Harenicola maris]